MVLIRHAALSVCLVLLFDARAALATADLEAAGWSQAESEHFSLFGDLPADALASAAADLERMRDVLRQIAPEGGLDSPVPTYVYLFRSEESFRPYRLAGSTGAEGGYLIPGSEATYAASTGAVPTRQVYKQYVLEILHRQLPGIPLWLRQGLAEYYGTFEADEREARIGLPLESHLAALGLLSGYLLPLPTLLGLESPPEGPEGLTTTAFYAQSWLLVHHLMSGDAVQRHRIADYVHRTHSGEDPVVAFRASFGIEDLDAFAATLRDYGHNSSFVFLRLPVATRESYAVTSGPLSEAETAFRQGDILLQLAPTHRAAAEARLRRAVALDPENDAAWEALGRMSEEAGDPAAALASYEKAAALAPEDFAAQLHYGEAKLRTLGARRSSDEAGKAALAAAREALRRAVTLRPGSGEAWASLGQAGVLAAEPDPDAPAALEKAVALLPAARTDVLFNLLLARARVGDAEGADRVVEALREAGAATEMLNRARQVQLQLTLQEARRLATAGALDDAVALLAVVRAESASPAVAEQAAALLERVAQAAEHNRFAERYSEAVELYRAGDLAAAAAVVDEMSAEARPGRQLLVLRELRARIQSGELEE
jgi:cytochrome c-type biogenesis protein CcmH/NrfG